MKKDIHPKSHLIKATCSCGNSVEILTTLNSSLHLDVCSKCHPFYTGQQKVMDTGGRIDKYRKRFGSLGMAKSD